jgi:hypothetical protein
VNIHGRTVNIGLNVHAAIAVNAVADTNLGRKLLINA